MNIIIIGSVSQAIYSLKTPNSNCYMPCSGYVVSLNFPIIADAICVKKLLLIIDS